LADAQKKRANAAYNFSLWGIKETEMNREIYIKEIIALLQILEGNIIKRNNLNFRDINFICENFYRDFLNKIYDLSLENLNFIKKNQDTIDLGDKKNKISFQITASVTKTKVKKTIDGFTNYLNDYDELFIFFIKSKNELKNKNGKFPKFTSSFGFDSEKHLLDNNDLIKIIENSKIEKIEEVYNFINKELKSKEKHCENTKIEFDENVPKFIFTFKNVFHIVQDIEELAVLLEETKLRFDSVQSNCFSVVINEELCLLDELARLKKLPPSMKTRLQIIDIENILKYCNKCKNEISFYIKLLLQIYIFNISINYKYLAMSLIKISKNVHYSVATLYESKIMDLFDYIDKHHYSNSKDIKIDVWKKLDNLTHNFAIYLSESELNYLKIKSKINIDFIHFMYDLVLFDLEILDLDLVTISEKVIPQFIGSFLENQYLIVDKLDNKTKKELLNLASYKIAIG